MNYDGAEMSYCELLNIAKVSDDASYTSEQLREVVEVLNQLPRYVDIHKRIVPLLHAKAARLAVHDSLSQETRRVLLSETRKAVVAMMAQVRQLEEILLVFREEKIPVILLKGTAFNGLLYSRSFPRSSNDIDLLVSKNHWQKATAAMERMMKATVKERPGVFENIYEKSFAPRGRIGAVLDLHMELTSPILFSIPERELWECSKVHPVFQDVMVRVLSPEHMLLHQSIHGYRDMNFCKYNLVDTHEILMQLKPDVDAAMEIAGRWGATIPLFYLLASYQTTMRIAHYGKLIEKIKPRRIVRYLGGKILESAQASSAVKSKTLRSRFNQVASHFLFTGSFWRPVGFQWLYLKSAIAQAAWRRQVVSGKHV